MNITAGFKIMMIRHGVSALELAKRRGISCRAINKAIGSDSIKKMETIESYCESIGCTVAELMIEAEKAK